MAGRRGSSSSDDMLADAWNRINDLPDATESGEGASVEIDEVELPAVEGIDDDKEPRGPVDTFVRSVRPPPPIRRPSPPPPPVRRPPSSAQHREPPHPVATDTKSTKGRGRWILAAVVGFGILRLIGSFDSDSQEGSSDASQAVPVFADDLDLNFDGFASTEGLTLVAAARGIDGAVSLTRKLEGPRAGAAWSTDRVPVADGFETLFVFEIDHVSWYTIGDGFAFVVQNTGRGVVGEVASGIGYAGIPNSLAVEFDTVYHNYEGDPLTPTDPEAPKLLANHVAVHTMGSGPNSAHAKARLGYAGLTPVRLWDRGSHLALIRYVPGTLSIYVDDLDDPVLVVKVDLDELLELNGGTAHVGFTAATAGFYADHLIHRWKYGSPCLFVGCLSP